VVEVEVEVEMVATREEANACRRFWVHVTVTALRELGSGDRRIQSEAEKWVLGDGFSWVCELFHIDSGDARRYVREVYWKVGLNTKNKDGDGDRDGDRDGEVYTLKGWIGGGYYYESLHRNIWGC